MNRVLAAARIQVVHPAVIFGIPWLVVGISFAINVAIWGLAGLRDVPDAGFDDCGKKAIKDIIEANASNTMVGSIAHGHAVPASMKNAFYDVITRHFNGELDDAKAVAELAAAAQD